MSEFHLCIDVVWETRLYYGVDGLSEVECRRGGRNQRYVSLPRALGLIRPP